MDHAAPHALDASTTQPSGRTGSSSTPERARSAKPSQDEHRPDAEDQDGEQEREDEDAVMTPPPAQVVEEDLGQVVAPSTPADSWSVAYIYAYLVKFTDLYPSSAPTNKSLLLDIKSFEDALLASSPPSTSSLRRDPKTGLLQSDYRPASTIHRATWLPSEITQAEYEYDQLVARAHLENVAPPPFPTTGPLSTELYEIPSPPQSALLVEIMQSFYEIMGYFPEFYNPKDRKGWFAWCVRFVNTRLGSGPLKGGIGWEVNLMRRVGVKIGREDEGNFWRLKWEEKVPSNSSRPSLSLRQIAYPLQLPRPQVHVIQHIIDYLLTYGKAIRREIKVAYDNERDPKDNYYESSSSSEDEADDASTTDLTAAAAVATQEEPEALNPLAFEPLGTTSTRTTSLFKEGDGVEVKESLMMIYALDASARLFGLAFPPSRGERFDEKEGENFSPADLAFEWRTLTRSIEEYNQFITRVEEVEAKDAQSAAEGNENSWLVDAPIQSSVKMRIPKIKTTAALGTNKKKRKRRATIGRANTPNKRPMRSSVLARQASNYFEVEEIEDEEASVEGGRRSLRTRAKRIVQQQQEQIEEDESTDEDDEEDDEFEPEPVPIPTKPLSQALKDRLPSVRELQTVLDGLHAQREDEEKFLQERLGGGNNGAGVASSSKITLDSIHRLSTASSTTSLPLLPPRHLTPPPPPMISARSARLRVQEEKAQHDYYTQLNEKMQRQKIQHELTQREHKKRQEEKTKAQALKIARAEEKKREDEERERSKREGERKELEKRIKERRAEGEGGRRVSKRLSLLLEVDEERLRVLVEEETKREEERRRRRKEEKREKEVRQGLEEAGEAKGGSEVSKVEEGGEVVGPPGVEVAMGDGMVCANGSTAPSPTQPPTTNGVEAGPVDVSVPANEESTPIVEAAPSPFLETLVAPSIEASAVPSQPEVNSHDSLPKAASAPRPRPPPPAKTTTVEDQKMPEPVPLTTTDNGIPQA